MERQILEEVPSVFDGQPGVPRREIRVVGQHHVAFGASDFEASIAYGVTDSARPVLSNGNQLGSTSAGGSHLGGLRSGAHGRFLRQCRL